MSHQPPASGSRFRITGRWRVVGFCLLAVATTVAWAQSGQDAGAPVTSVKNVDWQRYGGQWYELARLPNSFQRKCVGDVSAQYSAGNEGRIQVINSCRRDDGAIDSAVGEARKVAAEEGRLKVRFAPSWLSWLPLVWGDYWVLAIDDGYQTALVGTPDREYLWLLSRTPQRSSADIEPWLMRAASMGFDISRVMLTTQSGTVSSPTSFNKPATVTAAGSHP
ncbi:hypothetical protein GN316_14805 [Xylophilus sp. Kf1]|nr:hypothetical protein [Xylophilus sp. Kf1]